MGCNVRQDREYRPSDKEPFMNERQLDYFREKLMNWRDDVLNEAKRPLQPLRDEQSQSDPTLSTVLVRKLIASSNCGRASVNAN